MRIYKIFTSKYLALFLLTLLISGKLIAQTNITSNITIDQAWIDANASPWIISDDVTVTFSENLELFWDDQYFEITGSRVIIDGANKIVTIYGVTNYPGFVKSRANNASTALIKNIGIKIENSATLKQFGGWISQEENKAIISNCYSNGNINSLGGGGIAGNVNFGAISNCYSTGDISGAISGGIVGLYNYATISNCYSTGDITGANAGGISGAINTGAISNCYSSGEISGLSAGGIAGLNNSGSITDSRSSGSRTGSDASDIASAGTISNSINVTPSIENTWDNSIANQALTGLGKIWNTSTTPYTLLGPWGSYTSDGGSITPNPIPNPSDIIIIIGSDRDLENSRYTYIFKTLSTNQKVKFDWTYTTNDEFPGYDPFYYKQDGGLINRISNDNGSITQSGSSSIRITTSGIFELGIYSSDDVGGDGQVTISNLRVEDVIEEEVSLNITPPVASLTSCSGSSSTQTIFGVSGSSLTESVTVSAPSGFEISTSSGGTYSSSLTLTNTSSVSETIYVRLTSSATVGTISGSITATSSSTTATTTVSGTVNAIPSVNITVIDASGVNPNDAIICEGSSVTLTASGTTASYLWSTSTNSATITPSPSTTTTYTVTGTTSGCSNTASVTITVNALPSVNITVIDASGDPNDAIICDGSSVTLTASGTTADYLWSTTSTSSTITLSPSTNTTYTVTGTTTSGCANTENMTVTVNAIPSISIDESDVSGSVNDDSKVCIGGVATLTAIGGDTYTWSTIEDNTSQINPSISSITTYTVTGTTSGCSNTASITITVESLPALAFNSIALCNESTFLITNTTSVSNNESWTVSGNINVNNGYVTAGTIPGDYEVGYTDGCAQTVSATVYVAPTSSLPAITDGQASYKFDGTPKGPSSASYYMGYNGFNYSSPTRPTKPGFYKANNQSEAEAGCPTQFYIFRCTTCSDVPTPPLPGPTAPTPRP